MRRAKFTVACMATYNSSLLIPDSVKEGEELQYIRKNLSKCKTETDPVWIKDLEPDSAVTPEDIRYIEEVDA